MKKLEMKFVPRKVFCLALLILVFQFGCQAAQTQVNSPSSLAATATPTPETESYPGNGTGNSIREADSKQNDDTAIYIDFEIKDIGIGSPEAKVFQNLGKPSQSKEGGIEVCGGGSQKTLHYTGLMLVLMSDDKGQNYSVISVDVISSKWMTDSVLKIGADAQEVEAAFGQPNQKKADQGQTIFYYSMKRHEGGAQLFFQNNKLTRISWSLDFC